MVSASRWQRHACCQYALQLCKLTAPTFPLDPNAPSKFRATRLILLLLRCRHCSRGSLGKPSRRTMELSDRSMLSNWFCSRNDRGAINRRHPTRCSRAAGDGSSSAATAGRTSHRRTSVAPRFSIAAILLARRSISYSFTQFMYWGLRSTRSAVSLPRRRGPANAPTGLVSAIIAICPAVRLLCNHGSASSTEREP